MNNQQTRVILVRHGQSTYNAQGLFQGSCDDSVLTEKGRLQAYQTGIALANVAIDAVYSSPLRRTQETAKEILAAMATTSDRDLQIQLHPHLQEINLPAWEGLSFKYVRENLAQEYRLWKESPHQFQMAIPALEESDKKRATQTKVMTLTKDLATVSLKEFPVLTLYEKAKQFWQEILARHSGKTILVVSHGGTIRALLSTALGISPKRYHGLQQSNCGISILDFTSSQLQSARLEAINQTAHLAELLPKLKEGKLGMRLLLLSSQEEKKSEHQKLAEFLQAIPLDFCLSSHESDSQGMAQLLLSWQKSAPVHLQTSNRNFLQVWHQTIKSRSLNSDYLCTGLAIAEPITIKSVLAEVFGLTANSLSLNLKAGNFAILHYSPSLKQPILQAMNFAPIY
jgi:probable phosphoglycerate mutase